MKVPKKGLYKTAGESLKAAYRIIKNPKHWTQEALARDCDQESLCSENGEDAVFDASIKSEIRTEQSVAFCAMGAVIFVNGPGERKAKNLLIKAAEGMLKEASDKDLDWQGDASGPDAVFHINDYDDRVTARKNVLSLFKRAIALAK